MLYVLVMTPSVSWLDNGVDNGVRYYKICQSKLILPQASGVAAYSIDSQCLRGTMFFLVKGLFRTLVGSVGKRLGPEFQGLLSYRVKHTLS